MWQALPHLSIYSTSMQWSEESEYRIHPQNHTTSNLWIRKLHILLKMNQTKLCRLPRMRVHRNDNQEIQRQNVRTPWLSKAECGNRTIRRTFYQTRALSCRSKGASPIKSKKQRSFHLTSKGSSVNQKNWHFQKRSKQRTIISMACLQKHHFQKFHFGTENFMSYLIFTSYVSLCEQG